MDCCCDDLEEVERDPTGRFVRYREMLCEGTVYKAFDEDYGIEVAWNKVELSEEILHSEKHLQTLLAEADLFKSLKHENIIRCYHSWVDSQTNTINIITELFTSGNLGQYRKKHNGINNSRAIKNWARQILKGLNYLHTHNPPIFHTDLNCDNLFVNGNSGKVKIGHLGLATEFYDNEYSQLVDVYSFGMCMLQMITCQKPSSNSANKVTSGAVLDQVSDHQLRRFIEKCLAPVSERSSAADLLEDPFLASKTGDLSIPSEPVCLDDKSVAAFVKICDEITFKLQGEMGGRSGSISMTLTIDDYSRNQRDTVRFDFILDTDTSISVAEEMEKDVGLLSKDVSHVADLIEDMIAELVPGHYNTCNSSQAIASSQIGSPSEQNNPNQDENVDVPRRDNENCIIEAVDNPRRGNESCIIEAVDKPRGKERCSKEVVCKKRSNFLQKLFVHCGIKF